MGVAKCRQIRYNNKSAFYFEANINKGGGCAVYSETAAVVKHLSAGGVDAGAAAASSSSFLIMIVIMVVVMYFMIWRPESKRKKQAEAMRNSLKKGDRITTIGGIVGRIVHVAEDTIVIETSDDRVRVELAKWAVSSVGVQSGEEPVEQKEEKKEKKKPIHIL